MDHNSINQRFWSKLDEYLVLKKLKQTNQRKSIVSCFLESAKHVDVEELHSFIRERGHNIGLATVYRTLNLLKEADLVVQHAFSDGRSVFELKDPESHHDHIICKNCGKIDEFENLQIESLQEEVANDHGFKLLSHRLDLFGLCQSCQ